MRQRLGIARCLLNDPRLLVLDAPMNGLDPAGIQEFRGLIRSLVAEGRTVLISSHLLDEIERTCDMVAIIDRGRLIRQGRLSDLRDGAAEQVMVACDDNVRALAVLAKDGRPEHGRRRRRAAALHARQCRGGGGPAKYGPAGGAHGFSNSLTLFAIAGSLAAVLIGATAGSQDTSSGVFRSLVATGQSRIRLALVRIPGALLLLLPMLALGYTLEVVAAFVLAGGSPAPAVSDILSGAGWLAIVGVLDLTVTLGIGALVQSRGTAIGVMLAWELAGSRVVERISAFGGWRSLVSTVATDRFLPGATDTVAIARVDTITVTVGAAVAVVLAWIVVATAVGVWRTAAQDA